MKRLLFPLLFIALQLISCQSKTYTLNGTVADSTLEGKTVYLLSYNIDSSEFTPVDSAVVNRLAFSFTGTVEQGPDVRFLVLKPEEWPVMVILEKGEIAFRLDSLSKASLSGTPLNDEYQELVSRNDSLQLILQNLREKLAQAQRDGKLSAEQFAVYQKQIETLDADYGNGMVRFITAQASNGVGRYLFSDNYWWMGAPQLRQVVDAFQGDVPAFKKYKDMEKRVKTLENTWEGKKYTDIQGLDLNGKTVKLSDFVGKNKAVVIDFWASWCGPCRAKIPYMKELYAKFHGKGLEIVGVSLDRDRDSWLKATKSEKLPWPQFSNLKGWEEPASMAYGVNSIPHLVVIDRNGTIVSRNPEEVELEFILADLLN